MKKESSSNKLEPKLRFPRFNNSWKLCKIYEVATIIAGGTPRTEVEEFWIPKEIPWLSSGEVHKKYIEYTDDMISAKGMDNSSAKMVKENSVLIALAGQGKTRGTVAINRIPLTTNQSIAAMTFDDNIVPEFVFNNLEARYEEIRKLSSGDGARGGLNKKLLGNIVIPLTSKDEQIQIGSFFTNLDNIITLHQKKLELLKKYKRGLLNALMTEKIKFRKSSEWKEIKLNNALEIDSNRNTDNKFTKDDVLSVSDEFGVLNQIKFHGRSFAGEDISGYKIVKTGQIVYTRSPLASKPYGIIKIVGEETGIISPLYIVNNANNNIDPLFIYYYFDTPVRTNNYLKPLVRMGAKHTMNISNEEWLSGDIRIPDYDEQRRISSILSQIEKIILIEQKHLNKMKVIKKGLLQKMFI